MFHPFHAFFFLGLIFTAVIIVVILGAVIWLALANGR
jgi:heme/copper-type cytochrome/quinol oxidase subunit 4